MIDLHRKDENYDELFAAFQRELRNTRHGRIKRAAMSIARMYQEPIIESRAPLEGNLRSYRRDPYLDGWNAGIEHGVAAGFDIGFDSGSDRLAAADVLLRYFRLYQRDLIAQTVAERENAVGER